MKIAIFGSNGMIGSATTTYLSSLNYSITEVNRQGFSIASQNDVRKFDVLKDSVKQLLDSLTPDTIIINLIGVIRHKISLSSEESVAIAFKVNKEFPGILVAYAQELGMKVIQIATDCVYSGINGSYSEESKMNPIDVYGESKASGELMASNLLTLRVSIVGHEAKDHVELMDWVLSQPLDSAVNGFRNHFWNGITSMHFAKILDGILKDGLFSSGTFHLVPSGTVSKFELIKMIAEMSGRRDLTIVETESERLMDRTLSTIYKEKNAEFWGSAGYRLIPTIRMMLEEYFLWSKTNDKGE